MSKKGRSLREALAESQRTIVKLKAELAAGYMIDRCIDPGDLTQEELARRYDTNNFGRRTEADDAPLYSVSKSIKYSKMLDFAGQTVRLLDAVPVIGSMTRLADDIAEAAARARADEPAAPGLAELAVGTSPGSLWFNGPHSMPIASTDGGSFWFEINSPCTCCRRCGAKVPCGESYTPYGCAGRCFCGLQDVEGAG